MRIGMLSLPPLANYGGILQIYALQKVLNQMGHSTIFIDEPKICNALPFWKKPFSYTKRFYLKYVKHQPCLVFYESRIRKEVPIIAQHTLPFIEKYIFPRVVVKDCSMLNEVDFDAIVVGSDQIWRRAYYVKIENAFLSFAEGWNIKRISYAPSFGTSKWELSEECTQRCRDLIHKFDAVSVREDTGVDLCRKYFDIKAVQVLDPTLLLDEEDYIALLNNWEDDNPENQLMCYMLDNSGAKQDIVNRLSIDYGLHPFRTNSKIEDFNANLQERIQPPIEQWLNGFRKAKMVVTDSFHACAFSILFEKPFVVCANQSRGVDRIQSLLRQFDLEDQLISDVANYKPQMVENINWDKVRSRLAQLREKSNSFLKQSLEK